MVQIVSTLSFEREINIVINSIKTLKIMYIIKNHSKKEVGRGYLLAVQLLRLCLAVQELQVQFLFGALRLHWESHFLGRLVRSLGVPKERGVWNSQGGRKDKLFFPLHSLGLYNNNASFLRTVSGKNLLANPVILKCKLCE